MHYAKTIVALSLTTSLFAEQIPITNNFIDFMKWMKVVVKPVNAKTVEVVTPIRPLKMLGGGTTYESDSMYVKTVIERECLAYGGDVYFDIRDRFGDTVTAHSYDHEKLKALSPQAKMDYIKRDAKDNNYLIPYDELKKLYTDQRLIKGFLFDTDVLRPENFLYNTTCKDVETGKTIYTAKTKTDEKSNTYIKDTLVVTFDEGVSPENFSKPKITKTIESLFGEYITDHKENKYLLEYKFMSPVEYPKIVQSFCQEAAGKLIVDGSETNIYAKNIMMKNEMGCAEIEHPFVVRKPEPFKFMLITDTAPAYVKNTNATQKSNILDIQMQGLALSTAILPLGALSENNIGNRKLVSTLYSDTGTVKLINIQEIGGNKTYKNYKVQNNIAQDITDDRFVYSNLQLPQSIQNAKGSLVQQCSQYGAGKVSIDGYTATCSRQAYGNQCNVNLIHMRNDQFAGREAVGCR